MTLSVAHPRLLQAAFGTALGLGCLWVVLQWADVGEVRKLLGDADSRFLLLALMTYLADLSLRAVRWRTLMTGVHRLERSEALVALVVGYAVNNVLPARLGELFRADFCKRRYGISGTYALGSIILERLLDGAMVLAMLTTGVLLLDHAGGAGSTIRNVLIGGGIVAVLACCFIWLVLSGHVRHRADSLRWLTQRLKFLEESFKVVRTRAFAQGLALSLPVWLLESLAIWLVLHALDLSLGPAALLCLVGVASLSTLLPSAPAYMGSYHAAYALILVLVGSTVSAGVAAATSVQLFLLAPVTILGLLTLLYLSIVRPVVIRE